MPNPPRVIIYARYSTDLQNPQSVKDQIDLCRRYADRQGWQVVDIRSDEGISGTTDKRPDYMALQRDVSDGRCDIVLAESLDRFARNLTHMSFFSEIARHHRVEIHVVNGGAQDSVRVGIQATIDAYQITAIAQKTHRGLEARARAGKSAGGLSYGYRVPKGTDGLLRTGEREIVPEEATVICRIFRDYAAGISPQKIAAALNAEAVPAPRGRGAGSGHWKQNTINGNRERGTGILNNELYAGRLVWDRLSYSKDPLTGKRVSRLNPEDQHVITEVPGLRIVDDALWSSVKAVQNRQNRSRPIGTSPADRRGLKLNRDLKRRKHLLSGLVTCGICGGPMTVAGGSTKGGARRYYCANAKEKGHAVCTGMPGVLQTEIEEIALAGLRDDMLAPEAYEAFRAAFVTEVEAGRQQLQHDVKQLERQISAEEKSLAGLMTFIETGHVSQAVARRLVEVEERLAELKTRRSTETIGPAELPDDLPALWRAAISDLAAHLSDELISVRAGEELRDLIDRIVVRPDPVERGHEITIEGKLLEMLAKAKPALEACLCVDESSRELVAGARNRRKLPSLRCIS